MCEWGFLLLFFLYLDLSGGDFLKVDVVAATVDLIVLHVPVLQLQTQLPHHSLKIPVSTVHLDVVLLQLFLVANYLGGGKYSKYVICSAALSILTCLTTNENDTD